MELTDKVNREQVVVEQHQEPYIYMVEFRRDTNLSWMKRFALRLTNPATLFPMNPDDAYARVTKMSDAYHVDSSEFEVVKFPVLTDIDRRYQVATAPTYTNKP